IEQMAAKARSQQINFRPHFKTHQSWAVGQWFRELGIDQITVSSLKMAAYFAADGWKDITVAFPVNVLAMNRIENLAAQVQLNVVVESLHSVERLAAGLRAPVGVFVKIDTGYGRTGVPAEDTDLIDRLLEGLRASPQLRFKGFLSHYGHSYACRQIEDIQTLYAQNTPKLIDLKARYQSTFPDLMLSIGDTPSCSRVEDFGGVDEIRPGNFVFYDYTQYLIGAADIGDIAVAMSCPIVALHPERGEVVVHGGSVHFSTDRIEDAQGRTLYGWVVENTGTGWGAALEDTYVKKLSQEHGIIHGPKEWVEQLQIGDCLKILPIHSCLTADSMGAYRGVSSNTLLKMMA
ncbi:MAG: alanine racemase, partial [Phaeodactylibacter sp.]|nr:alanine racemase [Phaeodactylibacter sp.]